MTSQKPSPSVRLPLGLKGEVLAPNLAPNNLPSTRPKRWVAGRKAEILAAVEVGLSLWSKPVPGTVSPLTSSLLWKRAVKNGGRERS